MLITTTILCLTSQDPHDKSRYPLKILRLMDQLHLPRLHKCIHVVDQHPKQVLTMLFLLYSLAEISSQMIIDLFLLFIATISVDQIVNYLSFEELC